MVYTPSAVKTELAQQLTTAGFSATDSIPEYVTPPLAIITDGQPYIETVEGLTFTDMFLRLQVRLVSGQGMNEQMTDELDNLIGLFYVTVRDAVSTYKAAWTIESVAQPFGYIPVEGTAPLLATDVVITTAIEIKEVS